MKQFFEPVLQPALGLGNVKRWLIVGAAVGALGFSGCDSGDETESRLPVQEAEHDFLGLDEQDDLHEGEDHEDHEDHDDREDHEGHEEHGSHEDHAGIVFLTQVQVSELGIEVIAVDVGPVSGEVVLPAEIRFRGNSVAHITPRVTGMVAEVFANEGDAVSAGDPLAILESRELADASAAYLSAIERLALASADVSRSRELRQRGVVSEQAYFDDQQTHAAAEIEVRAASQSLLALGLDDEAIREIADDENADLTRYRLTAPISGTVIERHAVLGEVIEVDDEEPSFVIADASEVWVDIAIYPNVMDRVALGASANVLDQTGDPIASGEVSFVAPHIDERTRTGRARIVIRNDDGLLRPGMFVTVEILPLDARPSLRVPVSAIQDIEGEPIVFIETSEGYEVREVRLGQSSSTHVEVSEGLALGDLVVVQGAFALKAELMKEGFDDGHNH